MVVVSGALLLAMQTASRRLRVLGGVVTDELVQASTTSISAVVFTLSVRLAPEVTSIGADCDDVRTTMSRSELIFCGIARAATGVPEKTMSALGLAVLPEVSRI